MAGPGTHRIGLDAAILRLAALRAGYRETDAAPGRKGTGLAGFRILGVGERFVPILQPVHHGAIVGRFADDFAREGMAGRSAFALDAPDLEDDRPAAAVADAAVQGHLKCVAESYARPSGEHDSG